MSAYNNFSNFSIGSSEFLDVVSFRTSNQEDASPVSSIPFGQTPHTSTSDWLLDGEECLTTISHRELSAGTKHGGGDDSKEKKPPLNYATPLRRKIRKKEEEEEEEEVKAVPAPGYHFPQPDQGTLTNL